MISGFSSNGDSSLSNCHETNVEEKNFNVFFPVIPSIKCIYNETRLTAKKQISEWVTMARALQEQESNVYII